MIRRATLLAALLLLACGPTPHPVTPTPPAMSAAAARAACVAIWRAELLRTEDPAEDETAGCVAKLVARGSIAEVTEDVRASKEYAVKHAPPPPPPTLPPLLALHAAGPTFRTSDGKDWRLKGVSAFQLLDRWAHDQDSAVAAFLKAYEGYNTLRVWPYVPVEDWGTSAWSAPAHAVTRAFIEDMGRRGWRVELTLLTDDKPSRIPWAKQLVAELAKPPKLTNLLVEIGNEPATHKHIDVGALRATLEHSGLLYTSGGYESNDVVFGDYIDHHSRRTSDWARRSHDCHDWWTSSPDFAAPPHHVPCVLDEPPKMEDVHPATADDWRAYFGGASIMGAGATFHSQTGKFAKPPTAKERELAAAALEGLNAFPPSAPRLAYARPVEHSLRTYTAGGKYMVRVQPTTSSPGAGWRRIGTSNVLWVKE